MHLIVVTDPPGPTDPAIESRWSPLLARLQPDWSLPGSADALSTPAERAAAHLVLGRPPRDEEDGRLPWTAWTRGEDGAWGTLTPCHGLVGSDRITGLPPSALALEDPASRALFDAVQPLFASEGVELRWHHALEWHLQHETLRDLPCASVDRMVGDSMQRWQAGTPLSRSRLLRRLQNEAQMVLHSHPVNEARAARGALTVNSLWLSRAGAADQISDGPSASTAAARLRDQRRLDLQEAPAAVLDWIKAQTPEDQSPRVVLCGRSGAQAFAVRDPSSPTTQPARTGWWSSIKSLVSRRGVDAPTPSPGPTDRLSWAAWVSHLHQDQETEAHAEIAS